MVERNGLPMTGGWETKPLGDVVTLQRGYDLPSQERQPGTVPIVSSSGVSGLHSEAKTKAPGVVTGRYGTIGEVHYVQEDFWPLNTTLFVKDFKGNNERFIYYLLTSLDFTIFSDKSSVPGVNRNHLHEMLVQVPNKVEEQRRIAHVLGTLDDKIELNRRMSQTLEEIARALFKSWFVDFDPVHAKAAGREPVGMNAETAALFPSEFEDSALGPIPKGWMVSTVGQEVDIYGGSTPRTSVPKYWDGGANAWATPKDLAVLRGPILTSTDRQITDEGIGQISSRQLPPGTILMSSRAPVGYVAISRIPVSINQGFIAMSCNHALTAPYVLSWAHANMEVIRGRANGTTFQEISKKNFRTIPIIVPTVPIVECFTAKGNLLIGRMSAAIYESRSLETMRDVLLPRLLTGALRPWL